MKEQQNLSSISSQVKMLQCPVCQVIIEEQTGLVHFSFGKPSDRSGLYSKVCQYANNPKCINLATGIDFGSNI